MLSATLHCSSGRQVDEKRPTLSCDSRRGVGSQSVVWRLFAQVNFRSEILCFLEDAKGHG
jgi:hypothetical protein